MAHDELLADRYELGEVLGFGGMSEVQFARDLLLHRDVAIKILRPDLARDPMFYLRFRREAQNAAKLNHPTIVQVFDTGEADTDEGPLPFIVMEYVDGETLRDVLRANGPIAPRQAMAWMADVAAAMDFSHRAGIVHRDMKPANVMIDHTGAVKVMDFGIARAMDDTSATMTQTSAVMGTAQYLSPEQARGIKVDPRSDIYSMGCVLFELITGEPPFTGDSPIAVAHQHVHEDPRRPSQVNPDISPELDSVVMKAMSKNPANRYQTSAEFRSDLIKVIAGGKPSAPMLLDDDDEDLLELPTRGLAPTTGRRRESRHGLPEEAGAGRHSRRRRAAVATIALVSILAMTLALLAWSPWSDGQRIAIPEVTGLTGKAAKDNLEQSGFRVKQLAESSLDVAEGLAVRTAPGSGVPTPKDSEVTLYVSSGPERRPLPNLRGKSAKDAEGQLRKLGFTEIKTEKTESTAALKDKVVRTTPAAGSETAVNTTVVMFLGTGPREVTVPNLTGQTEAQARTALEQLGLEMAMVEGDSERPAGRVVSSSPSTGQTVLAGSVVQVTISRGNMFVVPDLRGKTLPQARAALTAAGWTESTITTTQRPVGLASPNAGRVLSQTPSAGSQMRKDGSVTLVIGRAGL
ncbi:serine/threonine protein kinase PknB [Gordonia hirsuta DSM 44140 = NBRC 16056]|uniref:non-specific serine/threonine protein kinase n=1 Tax=Gordonia hirsuta DSM 44140 = NBRC 16056 TaxID=1121927 RepID=L7LCE8_9ACTN|nr:Stk1 family PASTA domain-containing Ser/Thr kinase [Gordonia hirsuta]GAC57713.1 serine/threonine protein kinase PknB [Gordonia hirsuta DSM 44140 = NBRC 16056]